LPPTLCSEIPPLPRGNAPVGECFAHRFDYVTLTHLSQGCYRKVFSLTLASLTNTGWKLYKMMSRSAKICIIIRESTPEKIAAAILRSRSLAGFLELRLDYLDRALITGNLLKEWIQLAQVPVIVTFRRKPNGGEFEGSASEQLEVLRMALAAGADYIDLEIETAEGALQGDLSPLRGGKSRLIVSYHNFKETPSDLEAVFSRISHLRPDIVKVATLARSFSDNFSLFRMAELARSREVEVIVAAMGEAGGISRILGPSHGSLLTYASLERGRESAPGQFTVHELCELYHLGEISSATKLYGVVGYPLGHSLSPHIHNPAFKALRMPCCYLPLPVRELSELAPHLASFHGLSVTIPHKVGILKYADEVDLSAREASAANTLVRRANRFIAYNTDIYGIEKALQEEFSRGPGRAVVLGAGGAARAACAALRRANWQATLLARDPEKARRLALDFDFASAELWRAGSLDGDLLINATPVGMSPHTEALPIDPGRLNFHAVFDMVYNPLETRLLQEARQQGIRTISGLEMFVAQAARQFELWTEAKPPAGLMREIVLKHLQG